MSSPGVGKARESGPFVVRAETGGLALLLGRVLVEEAPQRFGLDHAAVPQAGARPASISASVSAHSGHGQPACSSSRQRPSSLRSAQP